MQLKRSKILDKLGYLLLTFAVGIVALILVDMFFMNLEKELDQKTENLKSKITIGEFISEDLYIIRSDFYELSTAVTNSRGRAIVADKIYEKIDDINAMLNILQYGGTFNRTIRLNIAGHHSTVKKVTYKANSNNEVPLEAIDLRPKLEEIKSMTVEVMELLVANEKLVRSDPIEFARSSKKIKRYYKSTPAFFTRISENNRRLLYEGEEALRNLEKTIETQKSDYLKLEILLIGITIVIVLVLGYVIAKQITRTNEELQDQQTSIRSILDAQPNIVIVSDGYNMTDANAALLDYFKNYKTFDEFHNEHRCICDFFVLPDKEDASDYITQKEYNGVVWTEYVLLHPHISYKVAMKIEEEFHYFALTVKKKQLLNRDFIMIISFNDITKEISNQRKLKELNDSLEHRVEEKTKELQDLNENLEQRIKIELDKNRKKDQQMIQQSRFAALGEMIGNIAHQWRQPLSAISSTSSGMQLQMQLGIASNEEVEKSLEEIMGYVTFLTQTIEDFRGFFKEDKQKSDFDINEVIGKTLKITSATYKDNGIEIDQKNKDEKYITEGFPSELTQVFLNILNNAKDALIENKVDKKRVVISFKTVHKMHMVTIQDNAGGIPIGVIEKVFDPYFTTKHQSQGTGIGLYMSKDIVEKHMHGTISVTNKAVDIDGKQYMGACFKIELPMVEI
jgi:signal transduction histidine kinase